MQIKTLLVLLLLPVSICTYGQSKIDKFLIKPTNTDSIKVETIIHEINPKVKNVKGDIFAWGDVLQSMRTFYQKVHATSKKCPKCKHSLYNIWFSSPAWTWEEMCGTAGLMKICIFCPKQLEYESSIQN